MLRRIVPRPADKPWANDRPMAVWLCVCVCVCSQCDPTHFSSSLLTSARHWWPVLHLFGWNLQDLRRWWRYFIFWHPGTPAFGQHVPFFMSGEIDQLWPAINKRSFHRLWIEGIKNSIKWSTRCYLMDELTSSDIQKKRSHTLMLPLELSLLINFVGQCNFSLKGSKSENS